MIRRKDIIERYGTPSIKIEKVALFDSNQISEEDVDLHIRSEVYSPYIIICHKEQFENVFKSKLPKKLKSKK